MDAMNLVDRAAELNEDGVYELADGAFGTAVQSFENAVRQMLQVYSGNGDGSTQQQQQQQQQQAQPAKHHTPLPTSSPAMLPPARSSVEVPFLNDDRYFLYSCTVTFNPIRHAQGGDQPSTAEIVFYCATIWFNLALAHHQHAQKLQQELAKSNNQSKPDNQEVAYERVATLNHALWLYQEAAQALCSLPAELFSSASSSRDDITLMHLAMLNNQAHILLELQDSTSSQMVLQQLFRDASTALAAQPNNFSVFEQSQINEFLRNALVFGQGTTTVMGAACA